MFLNTLLEECQFPLKKTTSSIQLTFFCNLSLYFSVIVLRNSFSFACTDLVQQRLYLNPRMENKKQLNLKGRLCQALSRPSDDRVKNRANRTLENDRQLSYFHVSIFTEFFSPSVLGLLLRLSVLRCRPAQVFVHGGFMHR